MGDIALRWNQERMLFDLSMIDGVDLSMDDGIETAVIISLFTDARADLVELPIGETDRRGWFGELFQDAGGMFGSKLWLLQREKQTEEVRLRAIEYARDALQWMIDDGIAQSIAVDCQFPARGAFQISVTIQRPQGKVDFKYSMNWTAESARPEK